MCVNGIHTFQYDHAGSNGLMVWLWDSLNTRFPLMDVVDNCLLSLLPKPAVFINMLSSIIINNN